MYNRYTKHVNNCSLKIGGDKRDIKVAFDLKNIASGQEMTAKIKADEIMKKIEFFKEMGLEVQRTYLVNGFGMEIGGDN